MDNYTYTIPENEHQSYIFIFDNIAARDIILSFYVKRNATLAVQFFACANFTFTMHCILEEEGASSSIIGTCIMHSTNKISVKTIQHHHAHHTTSTVNVKGVLYDSAHIDYHGTIRVEEGVKNISASQENKNIMMGNNTRAVSIPTLQILSNEVQCFHASATGMLDEKQLFYLTSRGIDNNSAKNLLIQAFLMELNFNDTIKKEIAKKLGIL